VINTSAKSYADMWRITRIGTADIKAADSGLVC
jgi:hypothetical protein